jgi:hypothetical protein
MAAVNSGDTHSRFAVIYVNGEGVPASFSLGNDGLACVTSLRLSFKFRMNEDFMFIDEEVFDAFSRNLVNKIEQSPICDKDSKQWLLRLGRF